MRASTRFSVAIHVLLYVETFRNKQKLTSDIVSSSVNTNPVVIRRIMGLLKEAGIVEIAAGTGGISLTRDPKDISLLDIYKATEIGDKGNVLAIHAHSAPRCPVGGNIEELLGGYFQHAQRAMEDDLAHASLSDLLLKLASLRKKASP